jgi:hypothetical protein
MNILVQYTYNKCTCKRGCENKSAQQYSENSKRINYVLISKLEKVLKSKVNPCNCCKIEKYFVIVLYIDTAPGRNSLILRFLFNCILGEKSVFWNNPYTVKVENIRKCQE